MTHSLFASDPRRTNKRNVADSDMTAAFSSMLISMW